MEITNNKTGSNIGLFYILKLNFLLINIKRYGGDKMNLSKGAQQIASVLKKENYNFELEKTYDDLCSHKKRHLPYRFDFCIHLLDKDILIEYDSELHFQYTPKFHKKYADFLSAQERDRRKNSYCIGHRIMLYRIPYWEINNINSFTDIINYNFLVQSEWHNNRIWTNYKKESTK